MLLARQDRLRAEDDDDDDEVKMFFNWKERVFTSFSLQGRRVGHPKYCLPFFSPLFSHFG